MENCSSQGPHVGRHCRRVVKRLQPVRDSNPGHLAYRVKAIQTELTGPPHIFPPIPLKFGTVTFSPAKLEFVIEFETENSI
ncbi:hypothetical protein DPMN_127382 [Dreissena polymorpha]|uniref:Uncharacterized protein n=1 Tax=Dreissena polymorpha TaxID=45954 RepID=A0A9D4GYV4_DREPO|nr:hypothetical protein DPMN_127382 [Dreissena polymorpha]